jgi:hypothetical protein
MIRSGRLSAKLLNPHVPLRSTSYGHQTQLLRLVKSLKGGRGWEASFASTLPLCFAPSYVHICAMEPMSMSIPKPTDR